MTYGSSGLMRIIFCGMLIMPVSGFAHHSIPGKFDPARPTTLNGIVTYVDWRNPHVHVFINVSDGGDPVNWAVELQSPIDMSQSGWTQNSVQPGDAVTVEGIPARDGSRQIWSNAMFMTATGKKVLEVANTAPIKPLVPRPTPRWPDGRPRLGSARGGTPGYWAFPSATSLVEDGMEVDVDEYGLLANINDAARVAPFQPWALGVYLSRQERFLRDDPMFLMCKPPGGPRQFQEPYGVEFLEDRDHQRIFVNIGSGNHNFRLAYLDGREPVGQVGGDDDNPLYYGRAVGEWDGDTLVLQTSGFNEDFWFSRGGIPHTSQLSMTEQFTRVDFDTLRYEVTIDDPGAYTRPWTATWTLQWVSGDLPFHLCQENRP
jgi:hypothetical protein